MTEANITTLFSANRQFLNQVRSLEDSDLSIMSRIAELRNVNMVLSQNLSVIHKTIIHICNGGRVSGAPKR